MSLALNYVINLLARREYSEFELRCKMQEKNFSETEIDEAIAHCQQKNWQNDQRFTENYLYYRAQRGYGLRRIQQELIHNKGIRNEEIQTALLNTELDWEALALMALKKKFPDYAKINDPKQKQKVWRYMLSHGFNSEDFSGYVGQCEEDDYF